MTDRCFVCSVHSRVLAARRYAPRCTNFKSVWVSFLAAACVVCLSSAAGMFTVDIIVIAGGAAIPN